MSPDRSYFETLRVADDWGVLEVASVGALVTRTDGRPSEATVAAPTRTAEGAKGDGWTLRLNAGWKLQTGARPADLTIAKP